jgi:predicted TIM-barrel fold metal-dependent hydrolase
MIIDCDSHVMPTDAFAYVDAKFAARVPRLKFDADGLFTDLDFPENPAHFAGTTPLPVAHSSHGLSYRGNSDIDARMRDYEQVGADRHFALPQLTGWWNYLIEPGLAAQMAHSWNVSLLRIMHAYPEKFLGVALVALQDVSSAIRELDWAVAEGFRALVLDYVYPVVEHPYGTTLSSHPELWPFFARVQEHDVPIFLHAVQHGHRMLNNPRFLAHGLDLMAPSDAQLNLVTLITSGLLDDFPDLKFIHAETGTAYIKSLAETMDARFDHIPVRFDEEGFTAGSRRRDNDSFRDMRLVPPTVLRERNTRYPSHYFRRNFFWTTETEEEELVEAIRFLGVEHFLFATDYPHNDPGGRMKFRDVELMREHPHLSAQDKEAIFAGNAQRLFKLA